MTQKATRTNALVIITSSIAVQISAPDPEQVSALGVGGDVED